MEAVEPRLMLSGSPVNAPPTVAQAVALGSNGPVTGTSASISVLGNDDGGQSNLVYNWSVASVPSGGKATFSLNGTNAARNDTVTFTEAGTYSLSVRIVDSHGLSVTSSTSVVVASTLSHVGVTTSTHQTVSPTTPFKVLDTSQSLAVQGLDQFGNALTTQPTFTWSSTAVPSGGAAPTIAANGAAATVTFGGLGSYGLSVQATSGSTSVSSSFTLQVAAKPTSFSVSQVGGSTPVTGTTAQFNVGGFVDQFNNPISATTTVSWTATSLPTGATSPTFAVSGATTTATFKAAGNYVLKVTEKDSAGDTLSQSLAVTVSPVLTSIGVSTPAHQSVTSGTAFKVSAVSQGLVAQGLDQFGHALASQPTFAWSSTTVPSGGSAPTIAASGAAATVTFGGLGSYGLSVQATSGSTSVSSNLTLLVSAQPTSFSVAQVGGSVAVTGTSAQFTVGGFVDQFNNPISATTTIAWTATSLPSGASAPTFVVSGATTTVTFKTAGNYVLKVTEKDSAGDTLSQSVAVTVSPVLTSIGVSTPAHQSVTSGTAFKVSAVSQGLVAQGLDQFGHALTSQPTFAWSSTTVPSGDSAPTIAASGAAATVTFGGLGSYGVSVQATSGSTSVTSNLTLLVSPQPTSFSVAQVGGSGPVAGTTAQFTVGGFVDQFNNPISATTTIAWTATSLPSGASAPTFVVSGGTTTVTFKAAGNYVLTVTERDSAGDSLSSTVNVSVSQVVTSVKNGSSVQVSGTSQALTPPTFLDQFGKNMVTAPAVTWSVVTVPNGASSPTLATSGTTTTATFGMAGTYTFTAALGSNPSIAGQATLVVSQTLTSITVTPGTTTVATGGTQQFSVTAFDQFHNAMATQPAFTWSVNAGKITSAGLFTAQSTAGTDTITVHGGSKTGTATATVQANSGGLQNAFLSSLVTSLDADGSIGRADMIQIFSAVAAQGTVTASEFSDLKAILGEATALNMPGYVQILAGDVINGNTANATYQGQKLGNLAAGSSATQLNELAGKWFLGTDEPIVDSSSYVYKTVAGSLFSGTPSISNEQQGMLGDCYFISALGSIANSNPTAIQNMFINNGDGTYTIRFYTGAYGYSYNPSNGTWSDGFSSGQGTADYVTVDSKLPTTASGMLVYSDYGNSYSSSSNVLWIALAEKAYAQWNQTGKEGRDGTNNYASIAGGWMATVDAQVLGHNATDYSMTNATAQYAINALAAHQAVTIGTSSAQYGLVADHAYAITGYSASSGTFTLYNPWGFNQPGPLTWSQLEAACDGFVVATTSGSTPISAVVTKGGVSEAVFSDGAGGAASQANVVAAVFQSDWSVDEPVAPSGGAVSLPAVDAVFAAGGSGWTDAECNAA
ncbi:MAG TPA: C2 family cysteine protease [Pirellulales bacterium]|nr:C2 family cysteine protease [Pirellulales bacterium]